LSDGSGAESALAAALGIVALAVALAAVLPVALGAVTVPGAPAAADAADSETASGRALAVAAVGVRASSFNGRIGKALVDAAGGGATDCAIGEPASAASAPQAPPIAIAI
jgi:hypothetical protein